MGRQKLPRETIIKFDALCVCVENPDKFIKNMRGMCEYYNIGRHKPLIIYKTEEGRFIRKKSK